MSFRHIQIEPLTPTIGAMISGVDLNHVRSEDVYEEDPAGAVEALRGVFPKAAPDARGAYSAGTSVR